MNVKGMAGYQQGNDVDVDMTLRGPYANIYNEIITRLKDERSSDEKLVATIQDALVFYLAALQCENNDLDDDSITSVEELLEYVRGT